LASVICDFSSHKRVEKSWKIHEKVLEGLGTQIIVYSFIQETLFVFYRYYSIINGLRYLLRYFYFILILANQKPKWLTNPFKMFDLYFGLSIIVDSSTRFNLTHILLHTTPAVVQETLSSSAQGFVYL